MTDLDDDDKTVKSDADDDERRRHPRTPLSLLVQFRFNSFEDFLAEYAVNISPGGMFIRTDKPNEEGSTIYLQFSLKDGSPLIEGMGRVVRVNPPGVDGRIAGMGIEFENFDEESMALIHDICAAKGAQRGQRN
jgi:molecular chaperone DnaK